LLGNFTARGLPISSPAPHQPRGIFGGMLADIIQISLPNFIACTPVHIGSGMPLPERQSTNRYTHP
jgi:hypothetical protein